jgi:hypothetical protein
MTFDVIALVCALGQSPSDCQPPTAFRQIFLGTVPNELRCTTDAQEHLAQASSLVPEGYWIKIICPRREEDKL